MRTTIISTAVALILPMAAFSAEKHVHGEAELFIVLEGKKALVELASPADNILGFEHMPKTEAQKAKVAKSLNALENSSSVITLSGGNCTLADNDVESPFAKGDKHNHDHGKKEKHHGHGHEKHGKKEKHHDHDEHKHGEKDDHHGHDHHEEKTHSSFRVMYTYTCDNAEQVSGATITAFTQFGGFEKIKVNWVKGSQQGSKTTTKADDKLSF